ncbi:hypothetical protein CcI49_27825 [Frankia sp. CcI49]|uniref:hypothetical protein n=1 Tax=unclassified Frankia TaxID=2632575 RepID=UPI0006CA3DFB|nr:MULTISPECIES: hypothetical protein [unclassified Frankia]KPM55096.1 hypothetical protein ACG83_17390 [Frankia sp. R43]ONH56259.1 hypothetical protein CcI49_27825 [Frankia sp. CcI49]
MTGERHVLDVESATEEIYFRCRRCHSTWHRSYTVARWFEDDGGYMEVYRHNGVPVPSPRSGPVCLSCGGLRVDWSDSPLPPLQERPPTPGPVSPRQARSVTWPSWRTGVRDEWPPRRSAFPFMLPIRPQLYPRTFHFP